MLHNSAAGTIIGKGGSKIKEIENESGCKLKCVGEKMPERVVLMHGDPESATKACSMMAEAIHEQYSVSNIKFLNKTHLKLFFQYGQNRPPVIMAPGQNHAVEMTYNSVFCFPKSTVVPSLAVKDLVSQLTSKTPAAKFLFITNTALERLFQIQTKKLLP